MSVSKASSQEINIFSALRVAFYDVQFIFYYLLFDATL